MYSTSGNRETPDTPAACSSLYGRITPTHSAALRQKQKALSSEISTKETEVNVLMGQIAELSKGSRDPDKDLKTRRDELKRLISEAEVGLKKKRERTVAPDRIAQLLEDVLSRQGRLELVELRSLPPEPLFNEDSIVTKNADKSDRKDAPKGERDSDSKPKGDVIQGLKARHFDLKSILDLKVIEERKAVEVPDLLDL